MSSGETDPQTKTGELTAVSVGPDAEIALPEREIALPSEEAGSAEVASAVIPAADPKPAIAAGSGRALSILSGAGFAAG